MGDVGSSSMAPSTLRATLPSSSPTRSFWQSSHPNDLVDHRSTPNLPSEVDVVVVGSGITASFATWELLALDQRVKVDVLEARTICSAATGRNGGHLMPNTFDVPAHVVDFEVGVYDAVSNLIEGEEVDCGFRRCGAVVGYWNRTYFEEAKAAVGRMKNAEGSKEKEEMVSVVEGEEELKRKRLQGAVGALVQRKAASLSPYMLVVWMWRTLLQKYGERVNLQTGTPVTNIGHMDEHGLVQVQTERGSVRAKHVVIATNGYASYLLPEFENILTPVQGQMSASVPHGIYRKQLIPYSFGFLGVGNQDRVMSDYLVQAPIATSGHLMFGGGRQSVPNWGVGVSDDSYVDPDAEAYLKSLPERLDLTSEPSSSRSDKGVKGKLDMVSSWTGIMGYSNDGFPWVGPVPDRRGVWLAAGYTGHGMTNAPGCGRYIAQRIAATSHGEEPYTAKYGRQSIPPEYVLSRERLEAAKALAGS